MTVFRGASRRVRPRRVWRGARRILSLLTVLSMLVPGVTAPGTTAAAGPCDAPITNPILCENSKPGNPSSEWDLGGPASTAIEGFATDISLDQGQTVRFKIKTTATAYRIDVYRLGYYGGMGARKVATVPSSATLKQSQPACLSEPATGLVDCGNWAESASWAVPIDAVSGVYVAKLVREDGTAGANHVVFVVRDDDGASPLLFQTSDTTWQAYNSYGGNSLYTGSPDGRAYKVSYNRPFVTRGGFARRSFVFANEYPMIRWLEANGSNVGYASGIDTDRLGSANLLKHKAFLSVGHDEYWSGGQRANVEAARNAGVHLAFFSGNESFWKTRWESAIDGSGTPYRTLVSYKETNANAKIDPSAEWTGTWRDPRFSPPADGGRPENGLTGTIFTVQGYTVPPLSESDRSVGVPAADGKMRFWRNTDVATLAAGQSATLAPGTLGFEWDEDLDNGSRPAGLIRLAERTVNVQEKVLDFGTAVGPGTATHSMTLYRHPSRALVFAAGTIQYAWGLDVQHDNSPAGAQPDVRMQQATVNLFADMGVQPGSPQPGLVAATASSDTIAPSSQIAAPTAGTTVQTGSPVIVSGTAADAGGGVVGGVEVSVDGGATWHRATGRESWSYSWTPTTVGAITLKSRAVDDSGNLETPGAGLTVNVRMRDCPCSVWNDTTVPAVPSVGSTASIEVGVKFRADADGWITGLRFYKGPANTGTHVGKLWTSTGALLGSATFTAETASGWQQVSLASPVAISANTTYVASYLAPNGGYAYSSFDLESAGVQNLPLRVLRDGEQGGNGVFSAGASGFPTTSYQATNYWVDVVFSTMPPPDTTPPRLAQRTPAAGATDAGPSSVTAVFSEAVTASSISFVLRDGGGALVPSSVSYDGPTRTATLTPNSPLSLGATYSATVGGATDAAGNVMAPDSWSFSTPSCPCSLWSDATTPAFNAYVNGQPLELAVKVRSDVAGYLTGLRFYKTPGDPGVHRANLWSAGGTLLATGTFGGETASGWQQVALSPAVAITPNTTYVASYHSSAGYYPASPGYFVGSGRRYGPLRALAHGEDGANGLFTEGGSGFPTTSGGGNNYLVDVVFSTTPPADTTPPAVVGRAPAAGATDASLAPAVKA
ncbi:MAG TPA: N,N-dimethylformamidase beta subunit family domain-containing protein, partial [Chloroflexota bacterium]|nr:N,N-dimethylformamidase beta subunit family domain-containing protein [Chloroflexota bacterium]